MRSYIWIFRHQEVAVFNTKIGMCSLFGGKVSVMLCLRFQKPRTLSPFSSTTSVWFTPKLIMDWTSEIISHPNLLWHLFTIIEHWLKLVVKSYSILFAHIFNMAYLIFSIVCCYINVHCIVLSVTSAILLSRKRWVSSATEGNVNKFILYEIYTIV